MKTGAN